MEQVSRNISFCVAELEMWSYSYEATIVLYETGGYNLIDQKYQYEMKAMCTAHVPCTKASSSAQVRAQSLIFGSGAHKIFHYFVREK